MRELLNPSTSGGDEHSILSNEKEGARELGQPKENTAGVACRSATAAVTDNKTKQTKHKIQGSNTHNSWIKEKNLSKIEPARIQRSYVWKSRKMMLCISERSSERNGREDAERENVSPPQVGRVHSSTTGERWE